MHGCFVFVDYIRQRQGSIDRKTLFHRVTAEELEFGTDDALLREIRDELMPKEMRIDPLRNTRALVPFDGRPSRAILLDVTAV